VDDRAVIRHCVSGDDRVAVAVARIASQGRASWPAVAIADDAIAARIARLVRDDPGAPLDELHAPDFYLATALAVRDAGALRTFEIEPVPAMQAALRRLRLPATAVEEITQALRLELFTGDDPKIASYAGRGEAWSPTIVCVPPATRRGHGYISASLSTSECVSGEVAFWGLWETGAQAPPDLIAGLEPYDALDGAVDIDGDGAPEILTDMGEIVEGRYIPWLKDRHVTQPEPEPCRGLSSRPYRARSG
jgi:hypothetical protein